MRKLGLLALLLLLPVLAPAGTATAAPTRTIPLPTDFQPEGIAVGRNASFYVGSLRDGDIYRGSLRTGRGAVFVDVSGRQAAGLKVHRDRRLLVVAGAFTGHAYVYDLRTGATLADLTLGAPGTAMINDVALNPRAAYFTDSFAPKIYRVPIGPGQTIGAPTTITVTGPAAGNPPGTFGLNGIAVTNKGRTLLVVNSALGTLNTVDIRTGVSRQVQITEGALVAGTLDGLVLRDRTAWVVQNTDNSVAVVRLSEDLSTGRVVRTITDPAFMVPTTAALYGRWLALVNARFDLGFPPPVGPGAPAGTTFDVVLVPHH